MGLSSVKPQSLNYIIGFIATDGSLSKDGRHIALVSKNRELLFDIRKALNIKNKVGVKARGTDPKLKIYSVLQIGDKKFYDFLLSIGFMPRKSLVLDEIKVDDLYFGDFLRGVIDGDGNISTWIHPTNGGRQWRLRIYSAAPNFIFWLKEQIEENFNVRGKLYERSTRRSNKIYELKFGKLAAKVVLEQCYYKGCLALRRKYKIARQCLQDKNRLSKYGDVVI